MFYRRVGRGGRCIIFVLGKLSDLQFFMKDSLKRLDNNTKLYYNANLYIKNEYCPVIGGLAAAAATVDKMSSALGYAK